MQRDSKTTVPVSKKLRAAWNNMHYRCADLDDPRYGGRGIQVEPRWFFLENFRIDMGEPPTDDHSVGRLDNDKNYGKRNCAWQTPKEQANNTSRTVKVAMLGIECSLAQLCRILGIPRDAVTHWMRGTGRGPGRRAVRKVNLSVAVRNVFRHVSRGIHWLNEDAKVRTARLLNALQDTSKDVDWVIMQLIVEDHFKAEAAKTVEKRKEHAVDIMHPATVKLRDAVAAVADRQDAGYSRLLQSPRLWEATSYVMTGIEKVVRERGSLSRKDVMNHCQKRHPDMAGVVASLFNYLVANGNIAYNSATKMWTSA